MKKSAEKYTLKIIDKNSLDEVYATEMSRNKLILWLSSVFAICLLIAFLVMSLTAVKYYIPGYGSATTEKEILSLKKDLDSLSMLVNEQQTYLLHVKAAIIGKNPKAKDTTLLDMKKVQKEAMSNILPKPEVLKKEAAAALKKEKNEAH